MIQTAIPGANVYSSAAIRLPSADQNNSFRRSITWLPPRGSTEERIGLHVRAPFLTSSNDKICALVVRPLGDRLLPTYSPPNPQIPIAPVEDRECPTPIGFLWRCQHPIGHSSFPKTSAKSSKRGP